MGRRIEVRVPSRIDLAGGWTDVPVYCQNKTGEVVNIAINQYVRSEMIIDDERKISLSYSTDMPTGSGLGTSGAMNVGLISTIMSNPKDSLEAAEIAYQFEALMGNRGGRQDQWASALGGINHLTFVNEEVKVTPLSPSTEFCNWLENHILLFNSHITHVSGELHQSVWTRYNNGDEEISSALDMIRQAGLDMASAISNESKTAVISSINQVMIAVDMLGKELHQPFRQVLAELTKQNLVSTWKAMGAGGGGVVGIVINNLSDREKIVTLLEDKGWSHIDWSIDFTGVCRTETIL
jgi:D-glycero-alpha-D-manno-heptose-7-phosphate kinase